MAGERYVLLGLGTVRSPWFTEVARWATVGSLPAEFVKCISAEEMRVRLDAGRQFSAVLVDAGTGAVDRDLIDLAGRTDVAVIVVDGTGSREWVALGARAVLAPDLTREQLIDALKEHARLIGTATHLPVEDAVPDHRPGGDQGTLVAVLGPGGTGTSTVAMALAQGLAHSVGEGRVLLGDFRLDAEMAMLHDARDVVPGVQELIDAFRSARPAPEEVRALTFDVVNRGYQLLLGLRRHRDWAVLRPRTFEASVDGLVATFTAVVADTDADVEGEALSGSVEVEERNVMARSLTGRADAVVAVGGPGTKGLHALVRTVNGLREHGVAPERILAVINQSPKAQRARAELSRAFADLSGARSGLHAVVGPIYVPETRGLDEIFRDGARLPRGIVDPITGAVSSVLSRAPAPVDSAPQPIAPGSLGVWADQELPAG